MSELLIAAILSFCPGSDSDHKGQSITTACQERMVNCMISKAGTDEATKKEFDSCSSELKSKYRSRSEVTASDIQDFAD